MPPLPLPDWRAEQLRLTVFPVPGATTRSADWWEAVTGSPPDESTANPKKGSAIVSGSFGQGKLVLRLEPDRIDWLLVPADIDIEALPPEGEFPHLGAVTEVLGEFSDLVERWLARNDIPDAARLAFGAVLKHPEADRRSGYLRLPDYVPIRVDPDSTDFLYQINLPVASQTGIGGLQINRLSKWSVGAYRRFALRLGPATGGVVRQTLQEPVYAFRLELDINTAPTFEGPLPRARFVDVYRELVKLGRDVAATGIGQKKR
jgi:hypothetical protein